MSESPRPTSSESSVEVIRGRIQGIVARNGNARLSATCTDTLRRFLTLKVSNDDWEYVIKLSMADAATFGRALTDFAEEGWRV